MIDSGADKSGRTPDGKTYFEVAEKPEIKSLLKWMLIKKYEKRFHYSLKARVNCDLRLTQLLLLLSLYGL